MFGFLPAPCQCFAGNERSVYRQHFCGLGTALHDHYGAWSRWLVNRDATFLSLMASALAKAPAQPVLRTCCNPLGSARPMIDQSPGAIYAASVTVCGLATKLADNAADERGWRRWMARKGLGLTAEATDTARRWLQRWDFPLTQVESSLSAQPSLERPGTSLLDAAQPTATAFGHIFGHVPAVVSSGASAATLSPLLGKAGQHLGRLIYTLDAAEDWAKDKARSRFNPLPADPDARQTMVQSAMADDFAGLREINARLPLERHGALIGSLWTVGAQQLTEDRLGLVWDKLKPRSPEEKEARQVRREARKKKLSERYEKCCGRCGQGCCNCGRRCERNAGRWACDCCPCDCCPCDCCFDCGPNDKGCVDCCPCDCS